MKRFLSLGAGVQSSTLALMIAHNEIEPVEAAIFADTGWEPRKVYEWLDWLEKQLPFPVYKVQHGNLRQDILNKQQGIRVAAVPWHMIMPSGDRAMGRRQCTMEYKIQPLLKLQRQLVGLAKGGRSKEHLATTIIGISWDETQRMRDAAFPWLRNEYPLVDMKITRQMCLDWCAEHGLELPPRSACIGCPFKSGHE
jgi:3'-phosphoadenosine 5'-phosphosulfate sulfotransferase (PAPS reductase)/FAD synthetase